MYVYNVALRVHYLISSVMINSLLPSKATYFITVPSKVSCTTYFQSIFFIYFRDDTYRYTYCTCTVYDLPSYEWLLDKYCSVLSKVQLRCTFVLPKVQYTYFEHPSNDGIIVVQYGRKIV